MTRDPKIYLQPGGTRLLTRANRRRSERKGLEAIFTSQKEGMKIEILTGAAGIMAGRFLSVFALFRADALRALGPWGRHHLISSHVRSIWNTLSDMRRWAQSSSRLHIAKPSYRTAKPPLPITLLSQDLITIPQTTQNYSCEM